MTNKGFSAETLVIEMSDSNLGSIDRNSSREIISKSSLQTWQNLRRSPSVSPDFERGHDSSAVVEDQIAELIVRWLSYCENEHSEGFDCTKRELSNIFSDDEPIMLVDVQKLKLVKGTTKLKYVALSYVWGLVKQFCTKSLFLEALMAENSLEMLWPQLASVVRDAIDLVDKMGEKYLWVDTLCIVQDDTESKHHQLGLMAEIYNRAMLTIVACHGDNANQRLILQSHDANQLLSKELRAQEKIRGKISRCNHSKRGWTYQETMLSRRKLYFLQDEIYFQCREGIYHTLRNAPNSTWASGAIETSSLHNQDLKDLRASWVDNMKSFGFSLSAETAQQGLGWPAGMSSTNYQAGFHFWANTISVYSKRNFSFDSDVLPACLGILSAFQSYTKWQMYQGIPETLLDLALLWIPVTTVDHRQVQSEDVRLPTWSWIAWKGEITWELATIGDKLIDYKSRLIFHPIPDETNIASFEGRVTELVDFPEELDSPSSVETVSTDSSFENGLTERTQRSLSSGNSRSYKTGNGPTSLKETTELSTTPSLMFTAFRVDPSLFTSVDLHQIDIPGLKSKPHWTWLANSDNRICLVLFSPHPCRRFMDRSSSEETACNSERLHLILLSDTRLSSHNLVNLVFTKELAAKFVASIHPMLRGRFTFDSTFGKDTHPAKSVEIPIGTLKNVMLVKEVGEENSERSSHYFERLAVGQLSGDCWDELAPTQIDITLR